MKPLRLSWPEIRSTAEEFREKYVAPVDLVPVPIIEIVEFDLGLEIQMKPGLIENNDIDAFLGKNLKTLFIDKNLYFDQKRENRLRFTMAHEVGHLFLHKTNIEQAPFSNESEWIKFRTNLHEEDNSWFERQANEFAGRLLVPKKRLCEELEKNRSKIEKYKNIAGDDSDDNLKDAISRVICSVFAVSSQVIYRRINTERVWEDLKL